MPISESITSSVMGYFIMFIVSYIFAPDFSAKEDANSSVDLSPLEDCNNLTLTTFLSLN